jgi:hypothetical protein
LWRKGVRWKGSFFERLIQEHEDEFAWFTLILVGALVLRFVLEDLGAWPWA